MKKGTTFIFIAVTFIMLNLGLVTSSIAQTGVPPPPPAHGGSGNQQPGGGGAGIGGGIIILGLLGAGYAVKKWYNRNKKPLVE